MRRQSDDALRLYGPELLAITLCVPPLLSVMPEVQPQLIGKDEKTVPGRYHVPSADIYETDDAPEEGPESAP